MKRVKSITIIGGGTAGWITASYFSRKFGRYFDVTIVDKKNPDRIGVGEATLLNFPSIMKIRIGLKE
jgi:2-polyprenyl-6-methoxyphenol hydroxylase-like FAD-dependent oxidoreductase